MFFIDVLISYLESSVRCVVLMCEKCIWKKNFGIVFSEKIIKQKIDFKWSFIFSINLDYIRILSIQLPSFLVQNCLVHFFIPYLSLFLSNVCTYSTYSHTNLTIPNIIILIAAKASLFVLLKNPRCPLKWSLKGLNLNIYINNSYLKGSVSQLYKLVLKDSPFIQKLSGTNLFPMSRYPYIKKLSKTPATSCVSNPSWFATAHCYQQPLVISNRTLELATSRGSQPLVVCIRLLKLATVHGSQPPVE